LQKLLCSRFWARPTSVGGFRAQSTLSGTAAG
jgi:hypothetical protein